MDLHFALQFIKQMKQYIRTDVSYPYSKNSMGLRDDFLRYIYYKQYIIG